MIIGSAGSGKTELTLEKMKDASGDILYVARSPFLVQNARSFLLCGDSTQIVHPNFFSWAKVKTLF